MNTWRILQVFLFLSAFGIACQKDESVTPPPAAAAKTSTSTKKSLSEEEREAQREKAERAREETKAKAEKAAAEKAEEEEEKDRKKTEDRVRSRKIAALKDKINQKRTLLQQKETQKTSFINMRTTIDNASIGSFNNNGQSISSLAGGLAGAGANGNAFGGLLGAGVGAYQIIKDRMDEAEQRGEVLTAREAVEQQLALLGGEISTIRSEIETLEEELDTMIAAELDG